MGVLLVTRPKVPGNGAHAAHEQSGREQRLWSLTVERLTNVALELAVDAKTLAGTAA